jgi:hypothetical protein
MKRRDRRKGRVMNMTLVTIVYCGLCGLWRDSREDVIVCDGRQGKHSWWCSAHQEPVRCSRVDVVAAY